MGPFLWAVTLKIEGFQDCKELYDPKAISKSEGVVIG